MSERELSLAVVGIGFPNNDEAQSNRRFELLVCAPGELVDLRREPENEHDRNAVAVFSAQGIQLGYLNAERAPWIVGKMLAGEEFGAVFQELRDTIGVIRIRFGGGAPTLPAPRPAPPQVTKEFFSDPEVPEWGA